MQITSATLEGGSLLDIKLTTRVECGASIHAIFQLTFQRIQIFFSLKSSQFQGESSLKISGRRGLSFQTR